MVAPTKCLSIYKTILRAEMGQEIKKFLHKKPGARGTRFKLIIQLIFRLVREYVNYSSTT